MFFSVMVFCRRFISTKMSIFFKSRLLFFKSKKYCKSLSFNLASRRDVTIESLVLSYSEMTVSMCKACYNSLSRCFSLKVSVLSIVFL